MGIKDRCSRHDRAGRDRVWPYPAVAFVRSSNDGLIVTGSPLAATANLGRINSSGTLGLPRTSAGC
jgi:hypothetical protein